MLIFSTPETWPANLACNPTILLFDADVGEKFNAAQEEAFAAGLRRHHALDDAKANRIGWIATGIADGRQRRRSKKSTTCEFVYEATPRLCSKGIDAE